MKKNGNSLALLAFVYVSGMTRSMSLPRHVQRIGIEMKSGAYTWLRSWNVLGKRGRFRFVLLIRGVPFGN